MIAAIITIIILEIIVFGNSSSISNEEIITSLGSNYNVDNSGFTGKTGNYSRYYRR